MDYSAGQTRGSKKSTTVINDYTEPANVQEKKAMNKEFYRMALLLCRAMTRKARSHYKTLWLEHCRINSASSVDQQKKRLFCVFLLITFYFFL